MRATLRLFRQFVAPTASDIGMVPRSAAVAERTALADRQRGRDTELGDGRRWTTEIMEELEK
jgi:hypothetical protein